MKPKIVVTRFSALGDVSMLASIIPEFIVQYPKIELLIVSRIQFKYLFPKLPNVTFMGVDLENEYKGLLGLRKLAQIIKKENPTHFADCHNVLRTQILQKLLHLKNTVDLDKGRNEKKQLTQKKNKKLHPLKSMHDRYQEVFSKLGFPFTLSHKLPIFNVPKSGIGVAPFAHYKEKMLPLETTQELVLSLAERENEVLLFGGGDLEKDILMQWENLHPNITSLAGKFDFKEELKIIKRLQLMISMDSANMHLASLVGTRVVSIWGATHPYLGFLGYGQQLNDCLQISLNCQPCSVFGNKPCYKKSIKCLTPITSDMIIEKI